MKCVFKLKQTKQQNILVLRLQGAIDDSFEQLEIPLLSKPTLIDVSCEEVTSINSSGIKAWVKLFLELRLQGNQIRFYNLAPPLVQISGLDIPLTERTEVISMLVPMYCRHCDGHSNYTHEVNDGEAGLTRLREGVKCYGCGHLLMVDDVFEDYLKLQKRQSKSTEANSEVVEDTVVFSEFLKVAA